MTDIPKTHVYVILDRSGSMQSVREDTIGGYNSYLENLKKEAKGEVIWNLTLFDHEIERPIADCALSDVPQLTEETFVPRGSTALIDAVCITLKEVKHAVKDDEKGLVVILTDGHENASTQYNSSKLKDLVGELEAKGNWTFTYLGADQDAWGVAQAYGFQRGNVAAYDSHNTEGAFMAMSVSSASLSNSRTTSTRSFYGKDKIEEKTDATES